MTRIKRFYDVHEPNENFLKYGVSITSEMAFTESLLLRKGNFLSRKRGRLFKKYFFRSLNGAFKPRKKGTFFTFKKVWGGGTGPHCPPPRFRGPWPQRGLSLISKDRLKDITAVNNYCCPLSKSINWRTLTMISTAYDFVYCQKLLFH